MHHKLIRSQRGFTMIELLTVLVIIGVLMSISLVAYGNARERARLARVKTNVAEIALALDDFARDHLGHFPALADYYYYTPPPSGYTTTPDLGADPPPDDVPLVLKRRGNAIVGGGPPLVDTGNPLQDDFYRDMLDPASFLRERRGEVAYGSGAMHPVDALARNGHFDAYPINPLKGPGVPMVNIAHILYDYDTQTNDFQWVDFNITNTGEVRTGVCASRPAAEGVYEPIEVIWDEETYPQGEFAYIPFEFTNEQGTYCQGYWIICYGNLKTLDNSDYNKFSLDRFGVDIDSTYARWPNLPPPYGDGNPTTEPNLTDTPVEYQVKRLVLGALHIHATVFEDQFVTVEQ